MSGKLMGAYEVLRARVDEWEYMAEQARKGCGMYADMSQEARERAVQLIEDMLKIIRETAA